MAMPGAQCLKVVVFQNGEVTPGERRVLAQRRQRPADAPSIQGTSLWIGAASNPLQNASEPFTVDALRVKLQGVERRAMPPGIKQLVNFFNNGSSAFCG